MSRRRRTPTGRAEGPAPPARPPAENVPRATSLSADEPPHAPPEPSCPPIPICPVCGHRGRLVWIHGEGRCPACGTVLDFCCAGAPLDGGEG